MTGEALVRFLDGISHAIVGIETVDRPLLESTPSLRVVSKYGVGLDRIDLDALEAHGVHLGWTPGVNRRSVAELALGFAIMLLRGLHDDPVAIRNRRWKQRPGRELSACTVGIVGCGHIGKELIRLLRSFGTRVLAHDIRSFPEFYEEHRVEAVELDVLLARSDVVTLHLPLDESTRDLISARRIGLMKSGACLINTSRGGLVDEAELHAALSSGRLSGAAFDVFAEEPPFDSPLLDLDNFTCSAHIGGSTAASMLAMGMAAIDGLVDARSVAEWRAVLEPVQ